MFNWQEGRQGTGYLKLPLIISEKYKFDSYIIKYPKSSSIPVHRDMVAGFKHYRFNFTFWGDYKAVKLYKSAIFKFWRFYLFRPDDVAHSVDEVGSLRLVFSVGWLV